MIAGCSSLILLPAGVPLFAVLGESFVKLSLADREKALEASAKFLGRNGFFNAIPPKRSDGRRVTG